MTNGVEWDKNSYLMELMIVIQWDINGIYPLVMTNSSPWKIPQINGDFFFWENHL